MEELPKCEAIIDGCLAYVRLRGEGPYTSDDLEEITDYLLEVINTISDNRYELNVILHGETPVKPGECPF